MKLTTKQRLKPQRKKTLKATQTTRKKQKQLSVLGIDEVGRGCLAGPLVVAALALNKYIPGIKDSKKLTPTKRSSLSKAILAESLEAGIGWVSPQEIDKLGLSKAMRLCIRRATKDINLESYEVIIDGNVNYLNNYPNARCLVKADSSVYQVSAASIIAKVARDNYMKELSPKYPEYSFNINVGYGTKKHLEAIKLHGKSEVHRLSFKIREVVLNSL